MGKNKLFSSEYFPSLQSSDSFFERLIQDDKIWSRIRSQLLLLSLLTFLYGCSMGGYHSFMQAISSGVKVSVIFSLVLLICFPAFFIVQFILGSRLKLNQMISIILSGFIMTTAIMVSFIPIVIIFLLTGSNYYFLQLLHISIFIFSGIFGMNTIVSALKYSCEKKNIYPQNGVVVFRLWVVILAFVGIQLAWNFRPFLGDRGQPFELFRDYEGNFYAALIYSVNQLVEPEKSFTNKTKHSTDQTITADTLLLKQIFEDNNSGN